MSVVPWGFLATAPFALLLPARALAHAGAPIAPHDLPTAWVLEPWILLSLGVLAWGYARGLRALWAAGRGRGIRAWEAYAFLTGWMTLVVALVSPVHPLGEVLFSGHMVQHELMMALAAPLLVLGRPLVPLLWAVPVGWRRRVGRLAKRAPVRKSWRAFSRPLIAFLLHAVAIWAWHLPWLYEASLTSDGIHTLQHLSFLGTALLFWHAIVHGRQGRKEYGAAVFYLFATAMHSGGLGALLTFAPRPWYGVYGATAGIWGLTPLEDQQLAGLIMWIPGGIAYLVGGLLLLVAWMRESEQRASRWEDRVLARAGGVTLVVAALTLLGSACGADTYRMTDADAAALTGGSPDQGRQRIRDYGCAACHTVPGVPGARRQVGPPLAGLAGRMYIAGVLPNSPENLIRWIQDPTGVDPRTAMPDVDVSPSDARDIAAYLYTLR